MPPEPAGDHQVDDEKQLLVKRPHDALADAAKADDGAAEGLVERRIDGANEKWTGQADAVEAMPDDARPECVEVELDVWKFRHVRRVGQVGRVGKVGKSFQAGIRPSYQPYQPYLPYPALSHHQAFTSAWNPVKSGAARGPARRLGAVLAAWALQRPVRRYVMASANDDSATSPNS